MPAQNPQGGQQYWFNGVPFVGVRNAAADTSTLKFWFNGVPAEAVFAEEGGSAMVIVGTGKKHQGFLYARPYL